MSNAQTRRLSGQDSGRVAERTECGRLGRSNVKFYGYSQIHEERSPTPDRFSNAVRFPQHALTAQAARGLDFGAYLGIRHLSLVILGKDRTPNIKCGD
jgi:hypothetical protein